MRPSFLSRLLMSSLALPLALTALPAAAHDFFLLPDAFVASGTSARIAATVGSAFPTPEIVVTPDRVAAVTVRTTGPEARATVVGPAEKALALSTPLPTTGPAVVAVTLKPRDVEYGEDRIDLILDEYQVSDAAKAAVAALPRPRTLKVDSRRFAKTIVCRTRCDGVTSIAPHGLELEFVPVADGRFRLQQTGAPVANYPVALATRDGKRRHVSTDARGEVTVPADATGPLMLFASTMATPASPGERFVLRLTSLTTERR